MASSIDTNFNSQMQRTSRPSSAGYHPSLWGDYFITHPSLPSTNKSETWMKQRVETLIDEVKEMLKGINNGDSFTDMYLIDALQRLGVDYHFEEEISEALHRIHVAPNPGDHDLHRVALRFRLLRQHRYDAPSDVFETFKDEQGKFASFLGSDVKGLLSLYEAGYLGKPGEDILDEAIIFARSHLQSKTASATHQLDPSYLARQVLRALEIPLRRNMPRLVARHYISVYEQDHEVRNEVVLELAKLDFHLLQQLHRQEIHAISMWWKKWDVTTKFSFARDRIAECYFWILGVYFEPHYSRARTMMTKMVALFSLMDDVYDAYGTFIELQEFTNALQRWNLEDADQLEECSKLLFIAITSTVKEFEDELAREGLSYRIHYLKEVIKRLSRAYLVEAKWREERCVPSFEDHLNISLATTAYGELACISFIGMDDVVTKENFDWATSLPKIIKSTAIICRFMDDVVSHELETKRDHVVATIHCYMKEHGGSIQEVCDMLLARVEDAWKDINKEFLDATDSPTQLLTRIINLVRMIEIIYRKCDGYTHSTMLKEYIMLLLVRPIDF